MPLKDPDARREYERLRWIRDREKRNAANVAYKKKRRAIDPDFAARERSVKTPEMTRAHSAVQRALRNGSLVRSPTCERCGAETFTEGAHSDYSAPLMVEWLCRSCHRRWDRSEPKSCVRVAVTS